MIISVHTFHCHQRTRKHCLIFNQTIGRHLTTPSMTPLLRSLASGSLSALLFWLGLVIIAEVRLETNESPSCQCSVYTNDGSPCENRTCHTVECYFIDTPEELECVAEFLTNVSATAPEIPINVALMDTDLDIFPDDFLVPYKILALVLNDNTMSEVPYRLINPICHGLIELTVFYGQIKVIPASGFHNCTALLKLDLSTNGITDIAYDAFVGLTILQDIVLFDNALQNFSGFEGIGTLTSLDLSLNKIISVTNSAFMELSKLESIDLSRNNLTTLEEGTFDPLTTSQVNVNLEENPFFCDCSLKWLKDWTNEHDVNNHTTCAAPIQGYLVEMDYLDDCNISTTVALPTTNPQV